MAQAIAICYNTAMKLEHGRNFRQFFFVTVGAAGRLAILSAFPETPAISSLEMRRNPSAAHAFRKNCLAMNDLAAELCQM